MPRITIFTKSKMDARTVFLPKLGHRGHGEYPKHVLHAELYLSHTYHLGDRWPEVARNRDNRRFRPESRFSPSPKWTPEPCFCPNEVTEATESTPNMLYILYSTYLTHIILVTGGQKWPEIEIIDDFGRNHDFHQVQNGPQNRVFAQTRSQKPRRAPQTCCTYSTLPISHISSW